MPKTMLLLKTVNCLISLDDMVKILAYDFEQLIPEVPQTLPSRLSLIFKNRQKVDITRTEDNSELYIQDLFAVLSVTMTPEE